MGELTFSPFQLDFISYRHSKLDILEGPSGCGKTAAAFPKFIDEVIHSKNSHHILACKDIQKTEQNILNNQDIGLPIFDGVATYYPRGKGLNTTSHVLVKGADGRDKVILLVTYSDSGKWEKIHGGWYGCTLIDEVNLVPSEDPEEISQFVTHSLQRTREHSIWTLNPDDPSKPIYKIINRARPIAKYKNKGPKEIRNLLCEEENPDYKWWFFDRSDNPVMTPEIEKQIYEAYKGTLQDQINELQDRIDKAELKLLRDIEYLKDQKERLMEIITPEMGGLKAELEYKIKEKEELLDILKGDNK
jgi:hypothetical protein